MSRLKAMWVVFRNPEILTLRTIVPIQKIHKQDTATIAVRLPELRAGDKIRIGHESYIVQNVLLEISRGE